MPYIDPKRREVFDPHISALNAELRNPGELNYVMSKLLQLYCDPPDGYIMYNSAMGVLECVKQEFYRKVVVPYEERKLEENGGVYP